MESFIDSTSICFFLGAIVVLLAFILKYLVRIEHCIRWNNEYLLRATDKEYASLMKDITRTGGNYNEKES